MNRECCHKAQSRVGQSDFLHKAHYACSEVVAFTSLGLFALHPCFDCAQPLTPFCTSTTTSKSASTHRQRLASIERQLDCP